MRFSSSCRSEYFTQEREYDAAKKKRKKATLFFIFWIVFFFSARTFALRMKTHQPITMVVPKRVSDLSFKATTSATSADRLIICVSRQRASFDKWDANYIELLDGRRRRPKIKLPVSQPNFVGGGGVAKTSSCFSREASSSSSEEDPVKTPS